MKQEEIIKKVTNEVFPKCKGLNAALLMGSFARGTFTTRSDIDFSLWVEKDNFVAEDFILQMNLSLPGVKNIRFIALREKIAVYFPDCPKMELAISTDMNSLDKFFLGSEIEDKEKSIVFAKPEIAAALREHLSTILSEKKQGLDTSKKRLVKDLVDKFIYEFENTSDMHRRSDSYRFYFDYNIALHVAIQLLYIAQGQIDFYFSPRNITKLFDKQHKEEFLELACSLYLPEANKKKRLLLDFFYNALKLCGYHSEKEIEDIKSFLEYVYQRDYIWNFRDLSMLCKKCRPGIIYRSSSFTRYQDSDAFNDIVKKNGITTIVDLRDEKEKQDNPYGSQLLDNYHIRYLPLPMDITRSLDYDSEFPDYSDMEKEYRWFALGNNEFFRNFFTKIEISKEVIMIHCHAGKDRTGAVCALIGLLLGESDEALESEYLESEMDSDVKYIRAFIAAVRECGGAEDFLLSCGVPFPKIEQWKTDITVH